MQDVLTIGDFWTGNVLVSDGQGQNSDEPKLFLVDLEFTKPGTPEFDVGQMAAEMLCLALFRTGANSQGQALLAAFVDAYVAARSVRIKAEDVAMRIGVHLLVIAPMAWNSEATPGQIAGVAALGMRYLRISQGQEALSDDAMLKRIASPVQA